jgi:hypothetical protein
VPEVVDKTLEQSAEEHHLLGLPVRKGLPEDVVTALDALFQRLLARRSRIYLRADIHPVVGGTLAPQPTK